MAKGSTWLGPLRRILGCGLAQPSHVAGAPSAVALPVHRSDPAASTGSLALQVVTAVGAVFGKTAEGTMG